MTTRAVALAAVAAVAIGLSGCATSGAAGNSGQDAGSKGAVAMSFAGLDIQIWVDELAYMKPAIEAAGYELISDDPQWNIQNQVSNWESWIQRGDVKAIMGYPVQSDSMVPVTQQAKDAGIPVVGYATQWDGIQAALIIDNYNDGLTLGKDAGEWIVKHYGNKKVPVAFFSYYETDLGIERSKGIKDGLAKAGANVDITDMPALTIQDGADGAANQLSAKPDTKVWLSVGSDQMIGAYRTLLEKGVAADDPNYVLAALDATNESLDVIKKENSIWRFGYILPAKELAANNVKLLLSAAKGEKPENITMSSTRVTLDNVDSFYKK